jgi:hypothetical protein
MSVEKFLAQRAVNVVVSGNYTLSNWLDANGKPRQFACRTSRVSPFRMMVDVPVLGRVGDTISTYFGDFGKLEGLITDTTGRSFLLELEMTRAMRQKLSDQLTWLEKKQQDPSVRDVRKQARIIPASPHSMLTFADGAITSCFVIDMSVSGAAVSTEMPLPEIGMPLAVGSCVGRVVRQLDGGFAVKFVEQQNREHLERRIIRAMPTHVQRSAARAEPMEQPAPAIL